MKYLGLKILTMVILLFGFSDNTLAHIPSGLGLGFYSRISYPHYRPDHFSFYMGMQVDSSRFFA